MMNSRAFFLLGLCWLVLALGGCQRQAPIAPAKPIVAKPEERGISSMDYLAVWAVGSRSDCVLTTIVPVGYAFATLSPIAPLAPPKPEEPSFSSEVLDAVGAVGSGSHGVLTTIVPVAYPFAVLFPSRKMDTTDENITTCNVCITEDQDFKLITWTDGRRFDTWNDYPVFVRIVPPQGSTVDWSGVRVRVIMRWAEDNSVDRSFAVVQSFAPVQRDCKGWEAAIYGLIVAGKPFTPPAFEFGGYLLEVTVEPAPGVSLTTQDTYVEVRRRRNLKPYDPARFYRVERFSLPPVKTLPPS